MARGRGGSGVARSGGGQRRAGGAGDRTVERRAATPTSPPLELVRSRRRRRTATAFGRDGTIVVQLPAGLPRGEEDRLVEDLVARVTGRRRAAAVGGDDALQRRARELADRYLDGVRATTVAWSARMRRRYASCDASTGEIRVSRRAARYPRYVLDHLLVHELAHLIEASHGPAFRALEDRHPQAERARGFLEGVEFAATQTPDELDVR